MKSLHRVDLRADFQGNNVAAYFLFSLRAKKASNRHLCILIQCHSRLYPFIIQLARMETGNRLISTFSSRKRIQKSKRAALAQAGEDARRQALGEEKRHTGYRAVVCNVFITEGPLPFPHGPVCFQIFYQPERNPNPCILKVVFVLFLLTKEIANYRASESSNKTSVITLNCLNHS